MAGKKGARKGRATALAKKKARSGPGIVHDEPTEGSAAAKVAASVDRELRDARNAAQQAAEAKVLGAADDEEDKPEEPEEEAPEKKEEDPDKPPDPYLLADADYIQKDTRWRNKQRTLVFCSRGVTHQFRHLCDDIRKMLPHHKVEPKFNKRDSLKEINEICELKSCNNVIYFESRKHQDLYMWLGRVPQGPCMKFQVLNIHTTLEVRLAGNCLLGSRPILHFDKSFSNISFLKLIKELFTQAFGTPRNHPKSKPFHDHIMSFHYLDKKIWFRHYQVTPEAPGAEDDPERQALTEIGPRFVLDPIRILSGSFSGQTLYANAFYMSPTMLRVQAKRLLGSPYVRRTTDREDRKKRVKALEFEEDPLDEAFA